VNEEPFSIENQGERQRERKKAKKVSIKHIVTSWPLIINARGSRRQRFITPLARLERLSALPMQGLHSLEDIHGRKRSWMN